MIGHCKLNILLIFDPVNAMSTFFQLNKTVKSLLVKFEGRSHPVNFIDRSELNKSCSLQIQIFEWQPNNF